LIIYCHKNTDWIKDCCMAGPWIPDRQLIDTHERLSSRATEIAELHEDELQ
jgi:hypothetical protein